VKHFNSQEWADFVRGVAGPQIAREMEDHAGKCQSCASELSAWAALSLAMRRERNYEPPTSVVRVVKAAMSGAKPETVSSRVRIFAHRTRGHCIKVCAVMPHIRAELIGEQRMLL